MVLFWFRYSTNELMPAFVQELVRLPVALVVERDGDAAVQEGELAQALGERVEAVLDRLEDLRVRLERDLGPALLRRAGELERGRGRAALVRLLVDLAVAPDLEIERLRQRVHDRHADAVQAARHLVAVVVELAAGVQHGQHDFRGRLAAGVLIDGNAAAVVDDGDRIVDVERDVHLVAVAGERLVDRVVDDLVDQVMESRRTGRADVHRGTLAHGLETLEDLDLVRAVVVDRVQPVAVAGRGMYGRRRVTVAARPRLRRGGSGPLLFVLGFQFRHQSDSIRPASA